MARSCNLVALPKPPVNGENREATRSTRVPVDGRGGRDRRDPLVRRHATSIRCRTRPACRACLRDRRLRFLWIVAGLRCCDVGRSGRRTCAGACIKAPIRLHPQAAQGPLAGRLQRAQWPAGPRTQDLRQTSRRRSVARRLAPRDRPRAVEPRRHRCRAHPLRRVLVEVAGEP